MSFLYRRTDGLGCHFRSVNAQPCLQPKYQVYSYLMVVRMRANRSKTGQRRSHLRAESLRVSRCECGAVRLAHRACPSCGKYNGKVIIDIVARTERGQRRDKRKEKALRESGQVTESEKANT